MREKGVLTELVASQEDLSTIAILAHTFQIHCRWAKVPCVRGEGVLESYDWILELLCLWAHIDWAIGTVVTREGVLQKVDTALAIGDTHDWVNPESVTRWVKSSILVIREGRGGRFLSLYSWNIEDTADCWGSVEEVGVLDSESARVVLQMKRTPSSPEMDLLSWLRSKDVDGSGLRIKDYARCTEIVNRAERRIPDHNEFTDFAALATPLIISPERICAVWVGVCILSCYCLVLLNSLEEVQIRSEIIFGWQRYQIVIGEDSPAESNPRELRAVYYNLRHGGRARDLNEGVEVEMEVLKETVNKRESAGCGVSTPISSVEGDERRGVPHSTATSLNPRLKTIT